MATVLGQTNGTTPSAWFEPSGSAFQVDCDAGEVVIESRRDSGDTVPKLISIDGTSGGVAVVAKRCAVVGNVVSGRQFRLVPNGTATAYATE